MMTPREMIYVLKRFDEGANVEMRVSRIEGDSWRDTCKPVWNFHEYDYRVKPEPREWYAYVDLDGQLRSRLDIDRGRYCGNYREVKVREVLE